uniref:Potassium channel domain-containing protein n=1 Tax=Amphora coffeiformis TaxID=265554 RepID=A0A7S3L4G4_9STRA|mmetsp:Transcript_12731/g.24204  ORF Transcript_12731/g.24204 Transcript_12731/m.24204 type:complete len:481 (+) Transcript_12731:159-1601(+)|eukprot:scaffold2593_cov170-Amphora_coffeaeformis.AAC.3
MSADNEAGSSGGDSHRLMSKNHGESPIEVLAQRLESRRDNRVAIPFKIKKSIEHECHKIATAEGYADSGRIHYEDLVHLREKIEAEHPHTNPLAKLVGFHDDRELKLEILDRAEQVVSESHEKELGWFYYKDFMFYHTVSAPQWKFMSNPLFKAGLFMFCFYLATTIFFCNIVHDENICPDDPTDKDRSYYGWVSALYFASTTMSTVGYGDLNVEKDLKSRVFYGTVYMIFAMVMGIAVWGTLAEAAFSTVKSPMRKGFEGFFINMAHAIFGEHDKKELLYQKIRRVRFRKLMEIFVAFCILNLIGIFVARYFVNNHGVEGETDWDWMTTLYWAVQTTTTIGYGDLSMIFEMRWFQIFYLTLSTTAAATALGHLATLSQEIADIKANHVWDHQEVSAGMIYDFRSDEFDDTVDQYEFAIASLILLGKITAEDLDPIMDKFRALCGPEGLIDVNAGTKIEEENHVMEKLQDRAKSRRNLAA